MIRGTATYDADSSLETGCRKDGRTHQHLTPGLFLVLCVHGICLGYQAMKNVESPQTDKGNYLAANETCRDTLAGLSTLF